MDANFIYSFNSITWLITKSDSSKFIWQLAYHQYHVLLPILQFTDPFVLVTLKKPIIIEILSARELFSFHLFKAILISTVGMSLRFS